MKQLLAIGLSLCVIATIADAQTSERDRRAAESRLAELTERKSALPRSDVGIQDEMRRLGDEVEEYRSRLRRLPADGNTESAAARRIADQANGALATLRSLNCARVDAEQLRRLQEALEGPTELGLPDEFRSLSFEYSAPTLERLSSALYVFPGTPLRPARSARDTCSTSKQVFTAAVESDARGEVAKFVTVVDSAIGERQRYKTALEELVSALDERWSTLEKQAQSPQRQALESLWINLLIMGSMGLLTIAVIRFYPEDLQKEWVQSGQIIQFVTVLMLLVGIMALSFGGVLEGNTTGTLLGGIAGYVLSQGVGRATARAVERQYEGQVPAPATRRLDA